MKERLATKVSNNKMLQFDMLTIKIISTSTYTCSSNVEAFINSLH